MGGEGAADGWSGDDAAELEDFDAVEDLGVGAGVVLLARERSRECSVFERGDSEWGH